VVRQGSEPMHSSDVTATGNRLKIGFVLARSFTLSAFALFVDTLRLASDELDRSGRILADWQVLGSTRHLITSSCGVQLAPTSDFVNPSQFDYIVVVGGTSKCRKAGRPEHYRIPPFSRRKEGAFDRSLHGFFCLGRSRTDEGPPDLRELATLPGIPGTVPRSSRSFG
jgi:hypothetical protein